MRSAWCVVLLVASVACGQDTSGVGSKKFTESVILGEVATQLLRASGARVEHRRELGGSRVLFNALKRGDLDVYPEYTGTLKGELVRGVSSNEELRVALEGEGIGMTAPLGFNNTYAIGMTRPMAVSLDLTTVSGLASRPELRLGFSNEFMDRGDGWPGLRDRYGLSNDAVGMDHDLAYRALLSGDIAAMDLYSTDAEIAFHDLVVLDDDLGYFQRYDAVLLYRLDLDAELIGALQRLPGLIDEARMSSMNRLAKMGPPDGGDRVPEARVASDFLSDALGITTVARVETMWDVLRRTTVEHALLVFVSTSLGTLVAVPLGVIAAKRRRFGGVVLGVVGVLQTIPSLALLVLLIPLFGLGMKTAVAALFLYSLLPIVRNTRDGLVNIGRDVMESAEAIGLSGGERLRFVELPLASPMILGGIKTSVVINIGTATLAALIGAGGYGQPILTGIRLEDAGLLLLGAVPAALMAVGVQFGFEASDRVLVPRGLRIGRGR